VLMCDAGVGDAPWVCSITLGDMNTVPRPFISSRAVVHVLGCHHASCVAAEN
jgi:hypothetical protein